MSPNRLIGDVDLTAASHQVIRAIESAPEKNGWHVISHYDLRKLTNRSKATIRRALLQLEEKGYLLISQVHAPGSLRVTGQYLVINDGAQNDGS